MVQLTYKKLLPAGKPLVHVSLWMLLSIGVFFPLQFFTAAEYAFTITSGVILPLIPPVYINFYLLDRYLKNKQYVIYLVWFIILTIISGALAQLMISALLPLKEGDSINVWANPFVMLLITSGGRYFWAGIRLQMGLHEAQAKQYKAELDLLKYQVNPHFFFNTLNNLFGMARKQKDQSTANGIAGLSKIMRYMIYDSNVEKIDIDREIEQINNFIELQKLRFSEDDNIRIIFNTEGQLSNKKIVPLLLIPFVENAFKHGVSLITKTMIEIDLILMDNNLHFSVKNTINSMRQNHESDNSGIGLENVKRRLQLLYPETHELQIFDDGKTYEVKLILEL